MKFAAARGSVPWPGPGGFVNNQDNVSGKGHPCWGEAIWGYKSADGPRTIVGWTKDGNGYCTGGSQASHGCSNSGIQCSGCKSGVGHNCSDV